MRPQVTRWPFCDANGGQRALRVDLRVPTMRHQMKTKDSDWSVVSMTLLYLLIQRGAISMANGVHLVNGARAYAVRFWTLSRPAVRSVL